MKAKANKQAALRALPKGLKLSTPSKMPGYTFALDAKRCITGSKLRKIPGSVCSKCYGQKGPSCYSKSVALRRGNMEWIKDNNLPIWQKAMVDFLTISGQPEFRYHDTGDLQSLNHLCAIVGIARKVPQVKFWLPTKEYAIVREYTKRFGMFPENLIVRVSSPMIKQEPLTFDYTSTVNSGKGFACPVSNGQEKCDTYKCRACWDKNVSNIDYHLH